MPIERAVPATCALAASRSLALRSGILSSAISASWRRPLGSADDLRDPQCSIAVRTSRLAEQERDRRGLQDEAEAAVLEDGDLYRDDLSGLVLGSRVVLLDELHGLYAVRPERRADGWGRSGLAGRQLNLDDGGNAAWPYGEPTPLYSFATWAKSSSTGVSRPKMLTRTFSLS